MVRSAKTYRINLIRSLREKERKAEHRRRIQILIGLACFGALILAVMYSGFTIWKMEKILTQEKNKLEQVRNEFRKYTATRAIVDKTDVELLNALQGRGIFWTKKLAALALHLPDNYNITGFSYRNGELRVAGTGYVTPKQDQLLVLDEYIIKLRRDTTFSSVFKQIHLNTAGRKEEAGSDKVAFEFSALTLEGMKGK